MRIALISACLIGCPLAGDAFAQGTKKAGITYQNVSASQCRSVCLARGWSADNCKSYCRVGSCKQAKTGGEHFCVTR
jgi:hypothetical protein